MCIVKFDSNGGSEVPSQDIVRGNQATKPTAPTKAGYSFEGWYNGDTKYDFTGAVTENTTLTARWKDSVNPVITGVVNDDTNPDTGAITSPQTGDNSNLAVWFALLAVSAAGVMGAGVYSKRRRSSR